MTGVPGRVGATADVVAAAARLLALSGPEARVDVLAKVLAERPSLRSLVLRTGPHGSVVACVDARRPERVGAPVPRRAADDHWVLDFPVRAAGTTYGVLTAISARPLGADDAELLASITDLFALLVAGWQPDEAAAGRVVLDVEADFALFATDLDETLGEALVALRHTDAAKLDDAMRAALDALRRVRRDLRATALHTGLAAALRELAEPGVRVLADDPLLDHVAPPVAVLVERVAEACCRNADRPVEIRATVHATAVKLSVSSADNAIDASELERWRRRVHALRGELRHQPGRVDVQLPVGPRDEGHHDHRPDL